MSFTLPQLQEHLSFSTVTANIYSVTSWKWLGRIRSSEVFHKFWSFPILPLLWMEMRASRLQHLMKNSSASVTCNSNMRKTTLEFVSMHSSLFYFTSLSLSNPNINFQGKQTFSTVPTFTLFLLPFLSCPLPSSKHLWDFLNPLLSSWDRAVISLCMI